MKRILLVIFTLISLNAFSQLQVKEGSFKHVPNAVMNDKYEHLDGNDLPMALIKISTENISEQERLRLKFQGNLATQITKTPKTGQMWIYISAENATFINFMHPDYGTYKYYLPEKLCDFCTYEMVLQYVSDQPELCILVISSEPADAAIYIDGKYYGKTNDVIIDLTVGTHELQLEKEGYATLTKEFVTTKGETLKLNETLYELSNLSKIYADGSKVKKDEAVELKKKQRQVNAIYQTDDLEFWWENLDLGWREIFSHILCNSNPTAEQLQSIVDIEEVVVDPSNVVCSLEPLRQMSFLKKLIINNNQIQDLTPLSDKEFLEVLSVSGNPIDNIIPLSNLHSLKNLNIENTPVADLTPIASLKNIKVLNIGGTSVRNLTPIAEYESLEDLSIVNTFIKSVVPLENLASLKHLKAYKTKIKSKHIELLKLKLPDLNVIYY